MTIIENAVSQALESLKQAEKRLGTFMDDPANKTLVTTHPTFVFLVAEVTHCRDDVAACRAELLVLAAKHQGWLDLIVDPTAGRSFENTFRISLINALYNGGKGLTVSTEYFQSKHASRNYTNG